MFAVVEDLVLHEYQKCLSSVFREGVIRAGK